MTNKNTNCFDFNYDVDDNLDEDFEDYVEKTQSREDRIKESKNEDGTDKLTVPLVSNVKPSVSNKPTDKKQMLRKKINERKKMRSRGGRGIPNNFQIPDLDVDDPSKTLDKLFNGNPEIRKNLKKFGINSNDLGEMLKNMKDQN